MRYKKREYLHKYCNRLLACIFATEIASYKTADPMHVAVLLQHSGQTLSKAGRQSHDLNRLNRQTPLDVG